MSGDFNINFTGGSAEKEQITNSIASFGMTPVFAETSRAGRSSNTCIDNIFIHSQRELDEAKTVNANISDHFEQVISIPTVKSIEKPKTKYESGEPVGNDKIQTESTGSELGTVLRGIHRISHYFL